MIKLHTVDSLLAEYGVKYFWVESGRTAVLNKLDEMGLLDENGNPTEYPEFNPEWFYWVELSWGSCGDEYDFAFNDFGKTFSEAFDKCIKAFEASALIPWSRAFNFKEKKCRRPRARD